MDMNELARRARDASVKLAGAGGEQKNAALGRIAAALKERQQDIVRANLADRRRSEREGLPAPLLKRLVFDEAKLADTCDGIASLASLDDPVGKTLLSTELDAGLDLYKVTCPIGVIGVIFESRPDALVQISALCLKSGNSVLLKGGSEARETNRVLTDIIAAATAECGIPAGWISLLETRADVGAMLKEDKYIDLIIPRGSNEFVRHIMDNSRIPVLGHADGICHCYVADDADLAMAVAIVADAKTQYVAACNAAETLLVHESVAPAFLPALHERLAGKVELIGCPLTAALIPVTAAADSWGTEYLDYKLAVRIVAGLDEAIDHINRHGSGHTDAIVTADQAKAARFMQYVDAANVFWNCSTRFSDGFRYGFGAEVGISTNKIHARGPVGLEGLVIYKYKLIGHGQIVGDYAARAKRFTHRDLGREFPLDGK
jgi:glutamate-5-semialdehyde dehydrogenase